MREGKSQNFSVLFFSFLLAVGAGSSFLYPDGCAAVVLGGNLELTFEKFQKIIFTLFLLLDTCSSVSTSNQTSMLAMSCLL